MGADAPIPITHSQHLTCVNSHAPPQDELYTLLPLFSVMELLVVLLYLGHFSGCFFYLLSTPPYQTAGEGHSGRQLQVAAGRAPHTAQLRRGCNTV